MPDFLPRRDGDLLRWSQNFKAQISASPEAYGLTAAEASAFEAVQQAYTHWYTLAQQPSTRTSPAVLMKNQSRDAMMTEARALAAVVRARPNVSNEQMTALGLHVRRTARRKVPRPQAAPGVYIEWARGDRVRVRASEAGAGRCARPRDVASVMWQYALGDAEPAGAAWRVWGVTGRPKVTLTLPPGIAPGTRVWVSARWLNERGEAGPWSSAANLQMNFGGVAMPHGLRRAA